jgi:hypothetical protein
MNEIDPIKFKFRWMEGGNVSGFMGQIGSFDGVTLKLADYEFPVDSVIAAEYADKVMSIVVQGEEDFEHLNIVLNGSSSPDRIKKAIDRSRSLLKVTQEQKDLVARGLGGTFRSQICPHCESTISLSRFTQTPQCFCEHCDSLFTIRGNYGDRELEEQTLDASIEGNYRMCDECDMYSSPKTFSVFYFVFLFYFIHWSSDKTTRCPACMRTEAWKMFFANIFGFLGLPVAIVQLFRSYRGKVDSGPLKGLDDANILANKGKIEKALDRYDVLMDNVPVNAGIKFNIGSGLLTKGDVESAETMFLLSLEDCANYWPSLRGLHFCYRSLDKTEELKQLESLFTDDIAVE